MVFKEKTIGTERIYEGKILSLRRDKVVAKANQISYREIVEHSGGAAIAALTKDDKMVLVKQYRRAADKIILEVPAGRIDESENPLHAAKRELKEETGYTANKIQHLASFYSSVGYSEEKIHLYLAFELIAGKPEFDSTEAIEILEYDVKTLKKMIFCGDIIDAKTIAAILLTAAKMGI